MKFTPTPATLFLLSLVAVAPAALAQNIVTSPPGYLTSEGPYRSSHLGTLPEFRAQIVDGEYRGSLRVLTEIGFRQESAPYSSVNAARSWTNVVLQVADSDFATMSSTFGNNVLSTPTAVFSGPVSWPGTPAQQTVPQAWEAPLALPFQTAVIFNGTKDILYDLAFRGGTLANSQSWGRMPVEYYLDSYADPDQVPATTKSYSSGAGCTDSGASQTATTRLIATAYGPGWSTAAWRNHLRLTLQAFHLGPNASHVHVLDIAVSPQGIPFPGVACQKLYLATSPLIQLYASTASASGLGKVVFPSGTPDGLIPYQASFAGITLATQAGWNDTATGWLHLTDGVEAILPLLPAGGTKHKISLANSATATSGNGPYDRNAYNQIIRLR